MVQFNYVSFRLYPALHKAYYLSQILRAPLSMAQNSFSQWTGKQFTILKLMWHQVGEGENAQWDYLTPSHSTLRDNHDSLTRDLKMASKKIVINK